MNIVTRIEMGCIYQDKITGFRGVAIGYCAYMTGCNQVLITPKDTDNKGLASHWFDEQRLDAVEGAEKIVLDNGSTPGFAEAAPSKK